MRLLLAALVCLPLVLAACGGDGEDGDSFPTPSGPPLGDIEYVQELCDGITNWVDAALTKSTEDELRQAVDEFIEHMRGVSPPEDARSYHGEFVKYLEGERSEPTTLFTKDPPLPERELRERLAAAEREATCASPLFTRGSPAPTPGR